MHDHEFEEQVHRKMEDLRLDPSAAVWVHVKDRLHQQRRRRMLWLPVFFTAVLLCSCLLLSDYYTWHPVASLQHTSVRSSTQQRSPDEKAPGNNQPARENSTRISIPAHSSPKQKKIEHLRVVHTKPEQSPYFSNLNRLPVPDRETDTAGKTGSMLYAILPQADTALIKEPVAAQVSQLLAVNGSYPNKITLQTGIYAVNNLIRLKKKGWDWGLSLQLTRVTFRNGSLNKLFNSYSTAADFPQNLSAANGVVGRRIPVAGEQGIGFSTGVYMKRHISRRLDFSTGLQYTLFATRLADDSMKHRNSYHFIELPAMLQWKISNGKRPLTTEAGVSFSRLLASNAVHYNSTLNGYYKDDHTFNRTQVSMRTGVYIPALLRSPHPLLIGPTIQYGITPLLSDAKNRSNHIFQYGLRLSMLIR